MIHFIREAGYGIWPVLLFGAAALALAGWHALRPRRDLVPLIAGTGLATVLFGALGTVIGLKVSVDHIVELGADERWIFLIGLSESLNNLVAALVIASFAAVLGSIGSHRQVRATLTQPATT